MIVDYKIFLAFLLYVLNSAPWPIANSIPDPFPSLLVAPPK